MEPGATAPPVPDRCTGLRSLGSAATFPAPAPARQLDHILADAGALRAVAVAAPEMPVSDHRPLIIDAEAC